MKKMVGHTTEDVTKLPMWARKRIERLTAEVESWKSRALSAASPDQTNVTISDGIEERGLPRDSHIRFRIGRTQMEVALRESHDGLGLEVRSLDGTLAVLPLVSNVISVKVNPR